jgi:ADP-ribose pyrophosphatase YjhB (NUDIX family)
LEETGLHIQNIRNAAFTNDVFIEEQKHYVTLFVTAEYHHGDLDLREPQKCERWEWFRWDELPKPRFLPLENLLHQGIKIELGTRKPLVGGRGRESRPGTGQGVAGPGTGPARKGRG